ncbi:MAG: hypothetical protein BroJett040_19950 [Oligoflexia bacterium]|nr:MAG: hypothetical protein BroJett040_19950 [Oligoflexia bacterium]
MFIQGDLQAVFDALYTVGAIDPVLKMDWSRVSDDMAKNQKLVNDAFMQVNSCKGDRKMLIQKLHALEPMAVSFVAVEVAREFAEFTDRKDLH